MSRFFRNRSVLTKIVSDKDVAALAGNEDFDPMEGPRVAAAYSEIAKDFITHAATTIAVACIAYKIVERICR